MQKFSRAHLLWCIQDSSSLPLLVIPGTNHTDSRARTRPRSFFAVGSPRTLHVLTAGEPKDVGSAFACGCEHFKLSNRISIVGGANSFTLHSTEKFKIKLRVHGFIQGILASKY
jgi:hypothetical protein